MSENKDSGSLPEHEQRPAATPKSAAPDAIYRRQFTATCVNDVLRWIEARPHHIASWIDEEGFFVLKGYGYKLRIPEAIHMKTLGLTEAGGRYDSRMYRATKAGRARLRRADLRTPQVSQPIRDEQS